MSEQFHKSTSTFDKQAIGIFILYIAYICYSLRGYFTSEPIPSVDLPGHIALIERLREQLLFGNIFFYDRFWFTGWPAYEFYAPLAHIFTALISYPLTFFSENPVRLSVHSLLVLGSALLPIGIHYAAWPYLKELISSNKYCSTNKQARFSISITAFMAIISCTLGFWFLNINVEQSIGIGFAGPFSVGLYTQLFGWLALLYFLGALTRLLIEPSRQREITLIVSFTLIFLTHTMTAVYAFGIALFCWCWFYSSRGSITRSMTLSLLLCSFWIIPFLANSGEMRLQHTMESNVDFFDLFIRYPLINLVDTFYSLFSGGKSALDITSFAIPLMLPILFLHPSFRKSKIILPVLVLILFLQMLSSSEVILRSFPIEIHFYRLASYTLLALLSILALVPFVFMLFSKDWRLASLVATMVFITLFISVSIFPSQAYRDRLFDLSRGDNYLHHQQVLDYFKSQNNVGRVLFENSQERITPGTTHFLPSVFGSETGIETVNGLYIQSSLTFTIISTYARLINLPIFAYPIQFPHSDDSNSELAYLNAIEELKNFGVTHIIAMTKSFKREIKKELAAEYFELQRVNFGVFSVFKLKNDFKKVAPVNKRVVGFLDLKGTVPFKLIEFYFHANSRLVTNFELLKLNTEDELPEEIDTLIINTKDELITTEFISSFKNKNSEISIVPINFKLNNKFSHYDIPDRSKRDEQNFLELSKYLAEVVKLEDALRITEGPSNDLTNYSAPVLSWDKSGQKFTLTNLGPKKLLRINYSFFPYWKSDSGTIYRGMGERMFFRPESSTAIFTYSRGTSIYSKLGYFLTFVAFVACLKRYYFGLQKR